MLFQAAKRCWSNGHTSIRRRSRQRLYIRFLRHSSQEMPTGVRERREGILGGLRRQFSPQAIEMFAAITLHGG